MSVEALVIIFIIGLGWAAAAWWRKRTAPPPKPPRGYEALRQLGDCPHCGLPYRLHPDYAFYTNSPSGCDRAQRKHDTNQKRDLS